MHASKSPECGFTGLMLFAIAILAMFAIKQPAAEYA